ncbi:putative nicotinamide N-methyase [Streptoalloteichus tenebrarius]|uniref:Nicotinamide N-methyase n=1 Tax=Streptoalloteichus tenebrarius (strain ATCC 17920 / DSM 40477 / JCM 4838 / CBS 697.72 / NBRC 16177 / NCIMB 11028 / NRRL B-12390 / A12253. 1 / ISP 5477) TaxID=1933 RepID=A0ABT1HQ05_STRSD|nr:50S ribosomal protein L11 methyltransferase [Streptoalloteichus tenebrarius]MCP2257596.1 putative nicotinamide N-methyase [Streptoalloteichus tenebrarius]
MTTSRAAAEFVRANTTVGAPPLVPEVRVHLAEDAIALWEATERECGRSGLPPPFWAFAWAGGQALARYVLDHPELVRGRRVLDLASGCGLVAVAAALVGAAEVTANDVDTWAEAAIGLNAEVNGVSVRVVLADVLGGDAGGAQVVLAGDVFYDRAMAARVLPFLERARAAGAEVVVGDPGRAHLPRDRFVEVARYGVPVPRDLEGVDVKPTRVLRLP